MVLDLDITKDLVFLGLTPMPHELHQRQIRAKSLFRDAEKDNLSIGLGNSARSVESSAHAIRVFSNKQGRTFVYNKKKRGPNTFPCGTP